MRGLHDGVRLDRSSRTVMLATLMATAPAAFANSSADKIRNCADGNWCAHHRTVDTAWRHSPLTQIVSRTFFAHARGLSIGDGRVYMGLADGTVVALDENTGKELWMVRLVNSAVDTAGISGAGTFVNSDLFVIGQNGGEYPIEGKIFGVDPKTGATKWTFYTTGRDDPKALATWGGDSWKYGGGGSWQPGIVEQSDPDRHWQSQSGLRFLRQRLPGPKRQGPSAGRQSLHLVDHRARLDTGKLNWYFQEAPSDPYDYDASPGEYVMLEQDGRRLVLHPGKNGFNHIHDVKPGQPINVYPDMKNFNWTTGFNLETGQWENMLWPKAGEKTLGCPAIDSGHSWNAGTYRPTTGLFYRIANEWCMYLTVNPEEGGPATAGSDTRTTEPFAMAFMSATWEGTDPPNDKMHGRLIARDPVSGDIKWEKRYDIIPHSARMSTASGLLFNATYEGDIEALDAETGDLLWSFNLGTGSNGGIVSYEANGKQYVAITTGHGS